MEPGGKILYKLLLVEAFQDQSTVKKVPLSVFSECIRIVVWFR
jgi:hypothetical protein